MRIYGPRIALTLSDAIFSAASLYSAFCLAESRIPLPADAFAHYKTVLIPLVIFRLLSLQMFGVYRISTRHIGLRDLQVIGLSTVISTLAFIGYLGIVHPELVPPSVPVIDWFVNLFCVAGVRAAYRVVIDEMPATLSNRGESRRILIVGAGARGASLAREIRRRPSEGLQLVGFVDDDPSKRNMLLYGASVLGPTTDIRRIVLDQNIDDVILAMPSAPGARIREITVRCEDLPIHLRISPGFSELKNGDHLKTLRNVSVEDLLRREPFEVDMEEIAAYLRGERVLITGAGGSIGSELVRQIVAVNPSEILLLGHGEHSIFELDLELQREHHINAKCLIADTRDMARLRALFDRHRPTVVFHAAAHKHVPMMELNPEEAITTNVLGTRNLARAASENGVKRFVMISTDKAVNPTSVMGASKRVAELVVQAEGRRSSTEFTVVRFGNVLDSRGSVVPTMRKQIERGGPVTVTHANVVRYFMTIPEAVKLVIQAGAMGGQGKLYMLDMGDPVRILDLARDLIRLSGLVPDKDIQIQITGLRPGEKLYEELLTSEEGASMTRHERIFAAAPAANSCPNLEDRVDALIDAACRADVAAIYHLLRQLEPSYLRSGGNAVVCAEEPRTRTTAKETNAAVGHTN